MSKKLSDWDIGNSLSNANGDKSPLENFKFVEHQLSILSDKARTVLMISGFLSPLVSVLFVFAGCRNNELLIPTTLGILFSLTSSVLSMRVVHTQWATEFENIDKVIDLRNKKTTWLHYSLFCMIVSLVMFGIATVIRSLICITTTNPSL